jgi:uncharacterized protein YbjT (DUF2867 family)
VQGDAYDTQSLISAMKGLDAVLSVLGTSSMKEASVFAKKTTQNIVDAIRTSGVKRLVTMSSFLAVNDQLSTPMRLITGRVMKKVIADFQAGVRLLHDSKLDWTVVYATRLTNQPKSGSSRIVTEGQRVGMRNSIARADVAQFMLKALSSPKTIGKQLTVTAR